MTKDDIIVVIVVTLLTVGLLTFAFKHDVPRIVPQTYSEDGGTE